MKAVALPISKTVARLIAQVQAEAEAATLDALSAKDGIVVLQPIEARPRFHDYGDFYFVEDLRGAEARYSRQRYCPTPWVGMSLGDQWHPSHWSVHLTLFDGQGRAWNRDASTYVIDDFGNLVPVA